MKEKLVSASINSCYVSVPLPAWGVGQLKRESFPRYMFSGFPLFADVADSDCVVWTLSASYFCFLIVSLAVLGSIAESITPCQTGV